jgi:hypothetical protein
MTPEQKKRRRRQENAMLEFLYNHDPFEVNEYSDGYEGPKFTDEFIAAIERSGGFEGYWENDDE